MPRHSTAALLLVTLAACANPQATGGGSPSDAGQVGDAADTSTGGDSGRSDTSPPPADAADTRSSPTVVGLNSFEDGQRGALDYQQTPEQVYEYVRFEVEQPVRITKLEAALAVPADGRVELLVWDDFGGNFFNFDVDQPLARVSREVTTADDERVVAFELDEPVDLVPGRMFYVGLVVDGDQSIQLRVDEGQEVAEGEMAPSLIWFSQEEGQGGFPAIQASPGDFIVTAWVEYIDELSESERSFASRPIDELGLASFSRAAVADVDGDGDPDLMTNGPRLYLNDGGGQFSEVTTAWLPEGAGSNGGVFGDFDDDGDPDYFATGKADRLLRNDGDRFVDVTAPSGIDDTTDLTCGDTTGPQHLPTEAAAWFDLDNDGWIDLYQANYECGGGRTPDKLWRNRGDGTFESVELPPAADGVEHAGRGVAPADADGDGYVDLFVTNYRLEPNAFYQNRTGALVDLSEQTSLVGTRSTSSGRDWYGHSIGAAWGDVDRDGRLDVFVANLAHPRFIDFSQKATLYMRLRSGALLYVDGNEAAGFRYLETPSNPTFFDYDADGDLDLFFTCIYDGRTSQIYRNDGHPAWTEVSHQTGVRVYNGWGAVAADLDLDGDVDLLARDRAFINRNYDGHGSVFVRPVGGGAGQTNRDGIGARVTATIGGELVLRERFGAHGTGVQDSPWLHVGLGPAEEVDLTVTFPASGETIEVPDVAAGSRITVHEDGTIE